MNHASMLTSNTMTRRAAKSSNKATALYTSITNYEYYDTLRADAHDDATTNWTINKAARRGDTVLLYVCAPVSAIVATARVSSTPELCDNPQDPWFGKHFADMDNLRLLNLQIGRHNLLEDVPSWRYWKQPRNSIRVPDEFLPTMLYAIDMWQIDNEPHLHPPTNFMKRNSRR